MQKNSQAKRWVFVGAVLGGIAVILGAFGAHMLERLGVAAERLDTWQTAVRYQMYHALAVLAMGILARLVATHQTLLDWSAGCMVGGVIIFSGLLYALVLTEQTIFGAIVPIGGASLIIGWILLAVAVIVSREE